MKKLAFSYLSNEYRFNPVVDVYVEEPMSTTKERLEKALKPFYEVLETIPDRINRAVDPLREEVTKEPLQVELGDKTNVQIDVALMIATQRAQAVKNGVIRSLEPMLEELENILYETLKSAARPLQEKRKQMEQEPQKQ